MKLFIILPKKRLFYLACTIFLLSCSSCSKEWLEEKPDKTMTVPETLTDFQGLLDNVVNMSQLYPSLGEGSSDLHYIPDANYLAAASNMAKDGYIWTKTIPYNNVGDWNNSYKKILWDNIILDGLSKIHPADQQETTLYNSIKGQALLNRGRNFYELAQIFSPPYKDNTAQNDLGVVLKLDIDINAPSKRSTVKQTYDQIIGDLTQAYELLPDRQAILTRGSKAAAAGFLSRVYLSMNDFNKSLEFSTKCLNITSTLMDFNTLPKNKDFVGRLNPEVILHSNFIPFLARNALISPELVALYSPDDLRSIIFLKRNAVTGTASFRGNYEGTSVNFFNGLATDEIYLNRAECYARMNKVQEAMDDLNTLLKTRWTNTVDYPMVTATDGEEALRKILTERKKELLLRGLRWTDLRRLNQDPRFAITLTRTVDGVTYMLEPNSNRYTFPIPDDIISFSNMPQNPGWSN